VVLDRVVLETACHRVIKLTYGDWNAVRQRLHKLDHKPTDTISSCSLCLSSLGPLNKKISNEHYKRSSNYQYSVPLKFWYVLPCNSRYERMLFVNDLVELPLRNFSTVAHGDENSTRLTSHHHMLSLNHLHCRPVEKC
jgi:hypothetical protein